MKHVTLILSIWLIFVLTTKAQEKYIWIRVLPDNFTNRTYYQEFPSRINYSIDSVKSIKCLKIKIDTISLTTYIKLKTINLKCKDCEANEFNCLVLPMLDFKGIDNFKITSFDLWNPWGFVKYDRSENNCLSKTMYQIFDIYQKPSNVISIIEFNNILLHDSNANKDYKMITQLKIK